LPKRLVDRFERNKPNTDIYMTHCHFYNFLSCSLQKLKELLPQFCHTNFSNWSCHYSGRPFGSAFPKQDSCSTRNCSNDKTFSPLTVITYVESILIGCSVLMITNLNDTYTWASWPNRFANRLYSWLCWLIAYENKVWSKITTLTLIADTDWEQDKISCSDVSSGWFQKLPKIKEPGWSAEKHKLGWQPLHVDFKSPRSVTRIFVFYLIIVL